MFSFPKTAIFWTSNTINIIVYIQLLCKFYELLNYNVWNEYNDFICESNSKIEHRSLTIRILLVFSIYGLFPREACSGNSLYLWSLGRPCLIALLVSESNKLNIRCRHFNKDNVRYSLLSPERCWPVQQIMRHL